MLDIKAFWVIKKKKIKARECFTYFQEQLKSDSAIILRNNFSRLKEQDGTENWMF